MLMMYSWIVELDFRNKHKEGIVQSENSIASSSSCMVNVKQCLFWLINELID